MKFALGGEERINVAPAPCPPPTRPRGGSREARARQVLRGPDTGRREETDSERGRAEARKDEVGVRGEEEATREKHRGERGAARAGPEDGAVEKGGQIGAQSSAPTPALPHHPVESPKASFSPHFTR